MGSAHSLHLNGPSTHGRAATAGRFDAFLHSPDTHHTRGPQVPGSSLCRRQESATPGGLTAGMADLGAVPDVVTGTAFTVTTVVLSHSNRPNVSS